MRALTMTENYDGVGVQGTMEEDGYIEVDLTGVRDGERYYEDETVHGIGMLIILKSMSRS